MFGLTQFGALVFGVTTSLTGTEIPEIPWHIQCRNAAEWDPIPAGKTTIIDRCR